MKGYRVTKSSLLLISFLIGAAYSATASACNITDADFDCLLGTGSATAGLFPVRPTNGAWGSSFLGTSQFHFNSYPGEIEASDGTSSTGDTIKGPVFKVSRTGTPAATSCANAADSECSAAAGFYAQGLSTDTMQTTGVLGSAQNTSTTAGTDSVGGYFFGRVTGSGVGLGTGAYIEGRRDTTTGSLLGAEVRGSNQVTTGTCTYNDNGIGGCDGLWVTSGGTATNLDLSTAVHIAAVTSGTDRWHAGITINKGSTTSYGVDDESSATNSYYTNGTHTYAFVSGAASGKVGIGTLSPANPLVVKTGASGVVMGLINSAGTCTHTPGASSETVSCSSDIQLKSDIHPAPSALAYFDSIPVREFKVKATGEIKTGTVAQEMLSEHASAVHMDDNGTYMVDEPNPWQLVKAIQELQAEVVQLRAEKARD